MGNESLHFNQQVIEDLAKLVSEMHHHRCHLVVEESMTSFLQDSRNYIIGLQASQSPALHVTNQTNDKLDLMQYCLQLQS